MLALRLKWPKTLVDQQDPDYIDELVETLEILHAPRQGAEAPQKPRANAVKARIAEAKARQRAESGAGFIQNWGRYAPPRE